MLGNICYQDQETQEAVVGMLADEVTQKMKNIASLEGIDEKTTKTIKEINAIVFKW